MPFDCMTEKGSCITTISIARTAVKGGPLCTGIVTTVTARWCATRWIASAREWIPPPALVNGYSRMTYMLDVRVQELFEVNIKPPIESIALALISYSNVDKCSPRPLDVAGTF